MVFSFPSGGSAFGYGADSSRVVLKGQHGWFMRQGINRLEYIYSSSFDLEVY